MNELQQKVSAIGVVPVIKLTNPTRDAGPLSDALCAGGVPVAEITFRAAGADEAMKIMLERHPDMLVGAGTVLTTEMVDKTIAAALDTGAKRVAVAGGVAANSLLRSELERRGKKAGLDVYLPPKRLCTDNAVMIGSAAFYRMMAGELAELNLNALPALNMFG